MKKVLIRIAILFVIFLAGLAVFGMMSGEENQDLTSTMAEASLPVICFEYDGTEINELHGYVSDMDMTAVRDTITPLGSDRTLQIRVKNYGNETPDLTYELRDITGERLISSGEISCRQEGTQLEASLKITNILDENTEYLLLFRLTGAAKPCTYYTRVLESSDFAVEDALEFAREYHQHTLTQDTSDSFLATYMDVTRGDTTTLQYVDLSGNLSQILWGSMEILSATEPQISFVEINSAYNALIFRFEATCSDGESETTQSYQVQEYFRLRKAETRMYVLDYERTLEELFQGESDYLTDSGSLLLGLRSEDVEYMTSSDQSRIAFVQAGELWCLNTESNQISRVFSFRSLEGRDSRESWNQHDIRIVSVDDNGDVDFVIYGYMNRGAHEGEVGMILYRYSADVHTTQELAFIPSDASYEILKAEMGQLMYENSAGYLYFMMQSNVYRLDPETLQTRVMVQGLEKGSYIVSDSHRAIAWNGKEEDSSFRLLNLETENTMTVTADDGNALQLLSFMGEDLIYGMAARADISEDATGITVFPMNTIRILNTEGDELSLVKEYQPDGSYVSDLEVEDSSIHMELVSRLEDHYVVSGSDTIVNREAAAGGTVAVQSYQDPVRRKVVQLTLPTKIRESRKKMLSSSEIRLETCPQVDLEKAGDEEELFYVYARGSVELVTADLSEAILTANENMGVVVASDATYMWRRARLNSKEAMTELEVNAGDLTANSAAKALSALLSYEGARVSVSDAIARGRSFGEILEAEVSGVRGLELLGLKTDDVLYYVSKKHPVLAMTGSDTAVLINGYTATTVSLYDPETGRSSSVKITEADELFRQGGYRYLAVLQQ